MHREYLEHAFSPGEGLFLMDGAQMCPPGPNLAVLDAVRTLAAALIPRQVLLAPSSAEPHVQTLLATC